MTSKKFLLTVVILSIASLAHSYDPQNTMLALNMAVVSVHRILSAKDRIILDAEYQNIINNLSIGNIKSDPEITDLYRKLLDAVQGKKLRQEESEHLKKIRDSQSGNKIKSALSEMAENSRKMLTGETGISSFFSGFGRLGGACAASYFKYQAVNNSGVDVEENLYLLGVEEVREFNELQKQLLVSSWNLLNKYNLPDEYRLVQKALDDFYRAVDEPDKPARKLRMLEALEDDFRAYPPYWFYRGRTALDAEDFDEAGKCFERFDEVWRPVLRKDPYKLEALKYRINEMLKDGQQKDKILSLAETMRDNTMREDWENNLFASALYYSLGENEKAVKCAEINIDFGYETEITSALLEAVREGVNFPLLPDETLRQLKLNRYFSDMSSSDKEAALILADYFDDRSDSGMNDNPILTHARRIEAFMKADGSLIGEIKIFPEDEISRLYGGVLEMVSDYADEGNIKARIFLADMYNYGWGTARDSEKAMNYYASAKENFYAQAMYVNLFLLSQNKELRNEVDQKNFDTAMKYYNAKDYSKAAEIFTVSAENGHASSQYMIGRMYEHGLGVSKNIDTAREWYTKSAENGEPRAKKALKRLSGNKSWWPF